MRLHSGRRLSSAIPDRRGLWLLDELCFKRSLKEGDEDEATRIMVMLAARGIARTAEREDAFRVRPLKLSACDLASNMERQALGHICAWDEGSNCGGFSDDGAPDFDIALVASFVARWCKQEPWAITKLESLAEFCQRIIDWPSAKWRSAALSFMTHLIGNFENISEVDRSVILSLMGSVVAVYTSKTGEHAEAEALMLVVMQHFSGNDALSIMESLNAPQQRPYSANTHLQLARSGLAVNAILGEIFFSADQRMSVLPETIAVKRASNMPRSIPPPMPAPAPPVDAHEAESAREEENPFAEDIETEAGAEAEGKADQMDRTVTRPKSIPPQIPAPALPLDAVRGVEDAREEENPFAEDVETGANKAAPAPPRPKSIPPPIPGRVHAAQAVKEVESASNEGNPFAKDVDAIVEFASSEADDAHVAFPEKSGDEGVLYAD